MNIEQLQEYNWAEMMNFADFNAEDIKEIIASYEGENDGDNWALVCELKDGRFAYVEAGCDYTGWDCRCWGDSGINGTLEGLIRWNLTKNLRARLDLSLPDLDGEPVPLKFV